jgi:hypothetical protein
MTGVGICHNATFPEARLGVGMAKRLRPRFARTITYWRDDWSSWRATLESCRDLSELGVRNLVLFNTEAFGGELRDIARHQTALHAFLKLAKDEYGSPVHAIEPINEADTDGWTIGEGGGPITAQWCADVAHAVYDVATSMFQVETVGPSFKGGPASQMVTDTARLLVAAGKIKVFTIHMYGRSLMSQPAPGWIWGTVEQGLDDLIPYIGDMQIDLTEGGCWTVDGPHGPEGQKRFVQAHCAFQHPRVRALYLFAINDWVPSNEEVDAGKDFGLIDRQGNEKPALSAFKGKPISPRLAAEQPVFSLGFRKMAALNPLLFGRPLEAELGLWESQRVQRTSNGYFVWSRLPRGGSLCFLHNDGRKFLWDESWPTYREVTTGAERVDMP